MIPVEDEPFDNEEREWLRRALLRERFGDIREIEKERVRNDYKQKGKS